MYDKLLGEEKALYNKQSIVFEEGLKSTIEKFRQKLQNNNSFEFSNPVSLHWYTIEQIMIFYNQWFRPNICYADTALKLHSMYSRRSSVVSFTLK